MRYIVNMVIQVVRKAHNLSMIRNKATYTQQELDKAVKLAREEGKTEGLAYGIYTLFHQDRIKKPSEMVVNTNLLKLSEHDLGLAGIFTEYELDESINMLVCLIEGHRAKAIALAIKSEGRSWSLDDPPYDLRNLPNILGESNIVKNKSVEALAEIIGDNSIYN